MAKTELDVLRGAYALLDGPEKWTKHQYYNLDKDACCLEGALLMAAGAKPDKTGSNCLTEGSLKRAQRSPGYNGAFSLVASLLDMPVTNFNDMSTYRDVRAVLRKAIKAAEKAAA